MYFVTFGDAIKTVINFFCRSNKGSAKAGGGVMANVMLINRYRATSFPASQVTSIPHDWHLQSHARRV